MRKNSLKLSLISNFLVVILFMSIAIGILGFNVIRKEIIERVQHQVSNYMKSAFMLYESKASSMGRELSLLTKLDDLDAIREKTGLDYLFVVDKKDLDLVESDIVIRASKGKEVSGTRIIKENELKNISVELSKRTEIEILDDSPRRSLKDVMAIEYARALFDGSDNVRGVLYGGKVINANEQIVDGIRDLIFGDEVYMSKPVGTVTIFQGDIRVATNVRKSDGRRALGTRVSRKVYEHVIAGGKSWSDRAFVVEDWYITAYEPIKDPSGETIGMLYVGILESPFFDMAKNVFKVFFLIIGGAVVLAVVISFLLAGSVVKPVKSLAQGTARISNGELDHRIDIDSSIEELRLLGISFNEMAKNLDARNRDLVLAKSNMEGMNKRYLDLISFVSHELKGILASTILNAYSVRDGFLGMVNFKQQKALDSVTRNLDHLDSTVKNFLNLSRIEKGEMEVNGRELVLWDDVLCVSVDTFQKQMAEKGMELENNIDPGVKAFADRDLIQVVANNLVSNAVKYGAKGGKIELNSEEKNGRVFVSVYNDGRVLSEEEIKSLFKRFARLHGPETKNVKGTGLGLFISREIIEKHGGSIKVEPGQAGNFFIFDVAKGG